MDFQYAKIVFVSEIDNNIRYYRSGLVKAGPSEQGAIQQFIRFMMACRLLDIPLIEKEKLILRNVVGNMWYETLEAGTLSREFAIMWKTTIHQANLYYKKCVHLQELMEGYINVEEYKEYDAQDRCQVVNDIQQKDGIDILIEP